MSRRKIKKKYEDLNDLIERMQFAARLNLIAWLGQPIFTCKIKDFYSNWWQIFGDFGHLLKVRGLEAHNKGEENVVSNINAQRK